MLNARRLIILREQIVILETLCDIVNLDKSLKIRLK